MHLLIIGLNFAPELTGVGKYTGELAAWLAKRGHSVTVITAPPYYPDWRIPHGYSNFGWRKQIWEGCGLVRCPIYVPRHVTSLRRLAHLTSFALSSIPAGVAALARSRPNVIVAIAPTLLSAPLALMLAAFNGAKTWLHIQDFEIEAAAQLGIIKRTHALAAASAAERFILNRFDLVSTISQKMLEAMEKKGVLRNRLALFPNWIDTDKIFPIEGATALRRELHIPDERCVVLYSGSMGKKQGLDYVIAAARRLAEGPGQSPLFMLAGAGPARVELEALAQGLANVRFLPLQPAQRLNELVNTGDIHVLPQRLDAADLVMPSKLGAMLASGKPVVATVPPQSQIALTLGEAGLIVPPENVSALADAIKFLAADAARRRQMGMIARCTAQSMSGDLLLPQMEARLSELTDFNERQVRGNSGLRRS